MYEDIQRSIQQDGWKLIRYPKLHFNQLFNLNEDPSELNNLAENPEHAAKVDDLLKLMETAHQLYDDPHPLTAETKESMLFDPSQIERKVDRHQPQWVVDKYF